MQRCKIVRLTDNNGAERETPTLALAGLCEFQLNAQNNSEVIFWRGPQTSVLIDKRAREFNSHQYNILC